MTGVMKRKVSAVVKAGRTLTQQPGPRVLIETGYNLSNGDDLVARLSRTVPTVRAVQYASQVNLHEWDCLVTWDRPNNKVRYVEGESEHYGRDPVSEFVWEQEYPRHLSLICLLRGGGFTLLDAWPEEGKSETPPPVSVLSHSDLVGEHISDVDGLPETLAALVRSDLVPVVQGREGHHLYFESVVDEKHEANISDDHLIIRPFLLGPEERYLAGSYTRNDESSVWLLPADIPDPYPWIREALREWHGLYRDRFPLLPDWHDTSDWFSVTEADIATQRTDLKAAFMVEWEAFKQKQDALDEALAAAKEHADRYERALLKEDGEPLVEAVACALADLGFHVVDMDQHWPDGDRREDLRVFEDGDPDWVTIVEVKGYKRGSKETDLFGFGRWAERFMADHQCPPSARWFITNHHRGSDPTGRPTPFVSKPEVLTTFNQVNGTVIDSRALFDLLWLVGNNPALKPAARAHLKSGAELIERVGPDDLVEEVVEIQASDSERSKES